MIHRLLFALFFVLFASRALGFDLGLAPGLSVKNAFLYVILIALAFEMAITRRAKLELLSVFVPFFLFILYALFTVLVVVLLVDDPQYSLRGAVMTLKAGPADRLLVLLIFFYGISDVQRGLWVLKNMLWLIVIGNVVSVLDILNILNLGIAAEDKESRLGGTIGSSNEFAYFVASFLPAIVALYWSETGIKKILAGAGAFFSGLAFLMAVSRGAIVGFVAGAVLAAWYLRSVIPPKVFVRSGFAAMILGGLVITGTFVAGYGEILVERFALFGAGTHVASSGRTWIWGNALRYMMEQPLSFITGFGWYAYDSAIQFRHAAHNTYLGILYDLGMIGVILFLLTATNVLRTVRAEIESAQPDARPFLMAFVFGFTSLLICIFFGGLYQSWMYIWAFVGVSLRLAVLQSSFQAQPEMQRDRHSDVAETDLNLAARSK